MFPADINYSEKRKNASDTNIKSAFIIFLFLIFKSAAADKFSYKRIVGNIVYAYAV